MTVPAVTGQYYPTLEELRDTYLRAIAAGAGRRGLTVNVLPGSEYYLRAETIAAQMLPAFANGKLGLRAVSPLDAEGDDLIKLAGVSGIVQRAAAQAAGSITVAVVSGSVTIPAGYQCTAPDGTIYETLTADTVADGDTVDVIATVGGLSTNKAAGVVVRWASASIGALRQNATVAVGGLVGGTDEDSVETVRQRLLDRLASPSGGGNWSAIKLLAENASASVDRAFIYPAIQGPASYGVAITKGDGDRTLAQGTVNLVSSAIVGGMPGHANLNVTSVTAEPLDVVIGLTLPLPVFAGGVGGGFRDGTPWPNASSGSVKITSFNSGTGEITTNATALHGLAVGNHIGVWDGDTMHEYTVATAAVSGGFVKITVVGGFAASYAGAYISAGAENLTGYASAALTAFEALGPGEKTDSLHLLPRALRKPAPATVAPYELGSRLLNDIQAAHDEIISAEYVHRYETGTTVTRTEPSVPSATTDPPSILTLTYLAFIEA